MSRSETVTIVLRVDGIVPLLLPPLSVSFVRLPLVGDDLIGPQTIEEVDTHTRVLQTQLRDDEVVTDLVEAEAPSVGEVTPTHPNPFIRSPFPWTD